MLKNGKSPGVDNISAEILKYGGPGVINALTAVCQKIWTSGQWPKDKTQSLIITLQNKKAYQQVGQCDTLSEVASFSNFY